MPGRRPTLPAFATALVLALALPRLARADETLSPGIVYSLNNGYNVVVAENDSDSTEVRVSLPHTTADGDRITVARHAGEEGATVAINANYFGGAQNIPCGATRGFGQQYTTAYGEAGNCNTTIGWARGRGGVFDTLGHERDASFMSNLTELATAGGYLLLGGQRHDWNHAKLEEHRDCSAVGISADRKRIILVVTNTGVCTGAGLQDTLLAHGASDAIHLDGGGSSKMWIRGRGYVNNEPMDRAPPNVILVRPNGDCPSDCGAARCIQVLRPFRAECLGQPCRAGLGAIWNCDQPLLRRARCDQGRVVSEYCATRCQVMPIDQDDVCVGGAIPEPMPDAGPVVGPDAGADAGRDTGLSSDTGAAVRDAAGEQDEDATLAGVDGASNPGDSGVTAAAHVVEKMGCSCSAVARPSSTVGNSTSAPWPLISILGFALVRRSRRAQRASAASGSRRPAASGSGCRAAPPPR